MARRDIGGDYIRGLPRYSDGPSATMGLKARRMGSARPLALQGLHGEARSRGFPTPGRPRHAPGGIASVRSSQNLGTPFSMTVVPSMTRVGFVITPSAW